MIVDGSRLRICAIIPVQSRSTKKMDTSSSSSSSSLMTFIPSNLFKEILLEEFILNGQAFEIVTSSSSLPSSLGVDDDWLFNVAALVHQHFTSCDYFYINRHHWKNTNLKFEDSSDSRRFSAMVQYLMGTLMTFKPAVASFKSALDDDGEEGGSSRSGPLDCFPQYSPTAHHHSKNVSPLTVFDPSMAFYHSSVIRLFFSVPTMLNDRTTTFEEFTRLFAPLVFKRNALQFNKIQFSASQSHVQPSPIASTNINKWIICNGQIVSRLTEGITMDHDRMVSEYSEITWNVEESILPFQMKDILFSIESFFDYSSPLISDNEFLSPHLASLFSEASKYISSFSPPPSSYVAAPPPHANNLDYTPPHANYNTTNETSTAKFLVHIIVTAGGSEGKVHFETLWESLQTCNPIESLIDIHIYMGLNQVMGGGLWRDRDQLLVSKLGNVHIHLESLMDKSPKDFVMDAWVPSSLNEYSIFITVSSDSITRVSRHFFEYVEQMAREFSSSSYFGISLTNLPTTSEATKKQIIPSENSLLTRGTFSYGMPSDFCMIYPGPWLEFLDWYFAGNKDIDPLIPNSHTNGWSAATSWKKYALRFMFSTGNAIIYPNFGGGCNQSLVYSRKIVCTAASHANGTSCITRESLPSIEELDSGLLNAEGEKDCKSSTCHYLFNFAEKKGGGEAATWRGLNFTSTWTDSSTSHIQDNQIDSYGQFIANGTSHVPTSEQLSLFDKFTLILTVYDRFKTIADRLDYYQNLDNLNAIVIVWNNINETPPSIPPRTFKVPIHIIKQTVNSLNNRFYPWAEITTDCVVNMDDDWNMPFEHIYNAIHVWKSDFFNHLVGHHHQGRSHMKSEGKWKYSRSNKKSVSIMLPSGLVYHRKYLSMYTYDLPAATRQLVDETMNCDDILFNFMVANATRAGPVVLEHWARPIDMGGLWKDPSHFDERDDCLNAFAGMFGYMPLMYTKSFFDVSTNGWPTLEKFKYSSSNKS